MSNKCDYVSSTETSNQTIIRRGESNKIKELNINPNNINLYMQHGQAVYKLHDFEGSSCMRDFTWELNISM